MEHTGHLTGHDAAPLHVSLEHRPAETAEGDVFQLLQRGSPLFQGEVFPGHFVFQHPHRPADGAARHGGVAVLGLQKGQLVVFVDGALPACQQAGAHLNATGPQSEGRCRLPSVGNAAGGDDGDVHRVDDLGHQRHGGHLTYMAAGLHALGDDGVGSLIHQPLGKDGGRHHGQHLDPGSFPRGDVLAGTARPGGHHLNALLYDDLGHFVGAGVHQHQIDPEGLVRQALADADLLTQQVCIQHPAGGDDAQRPRVGAGGGKFAGGDVGHAALDNGELRPQQLVEFFHSIAPFQKKAQAISSTAPPHVRPPPKAVSSRRLPGPTRPCSTSSLRTSGTLAAAVLP